MQGNYRRIKLIRVNYSVIEENMMKKGGLIGSVSLNLRSISAYDVSNLFQ